MDLGALLGSLSSEAEVKGPTDVQVAGLTYDSRKVNPGDVFFCIKGFTTDGHLYVEEAVQRGAAAIVHQDPVSIPRGRTSVQVVDSRRALGLMSASFYQHPSRRLKVIGVTGTKGKTTTTYLIKAALEAAGHTVGLIGTNQNLIGDRALKAYRTTPESLDLQRLFSQMASEGCTFAVMEVSSHAVSLGRIVGTEFDLAVFTNITRDHLDFHETFDQYLSAKAGLFTTLGLGPKKAWAVVNGDDGNSGRIVADAQVPVYWYGIKGQGDYRAEDINVTPGGVHYTALTPQGPCHLNLKLTGEFNVYNSLAALTAVSVLGVPMEAATRGLEGVTGVAGRFESVSLGQDYTVVVDYAHSPDSLQNVLQTARALTKGKVLIAFGCGGDRDKGKRPEMGKIAAQLADYVLITSDNPRSENPAAICADIEAGIKDLPEHGPYEVMVDRAQAIHRAISLAESDDLVVIAGKGHETYQIFAEKTIHFDDREVAAEAIRARSGR